MLQCPLRTSLCAFRGYDPFLQCCHLCARLTEESTETAGPVGRKLELFWFGLRGLWGIWSESWERDSLKSPVNMLLLSWWCFPGFPEQGYALF